jgi:hypothetical protein
MRRKQICAALIAAFLVLVMPSAMITWRTGFQYGIMSNPDHGKNSVQGARVGIPRASSPPTFVDVGGNAPLYYVPITLTNNQGSSTPANFQQQVTINPSANASIYA